MCFPSSPIDNDAVIGIRTLLINTDRYDSCGGETALRLANLHSQRQLRRKAIHISIRDGYRGKKDAAGFTKHYLSCIFLPRLANIKVKWDVHPFLTEKFQHFSRPSRIPMPIANEHLYHTKINTAPPMFLTTDLNNYTSRLAARHIVRRGFLEIACR